MPSDGSSRRRSHGSGTSARASARICCSPPESAPPLRSRSRVSRGKSSEHALDRPFLGLARIRRPRQAQIFKRAQARKDAAALRHISDAEPAAFVRRPARHVHAVDNDLAAARRQQPHDGLHERGLAHAIVADNSDRLALPELQRDAVKHRDFAVAGLQIRDVEDEAVRLDACLGRVLVDFGIASFANGHARFPR